MCNKNIRIGKIETPYRNLGNETLNEYEKEFFKQMMIDPATLSPRVTYSGCFTIYYSPDSGRLFFRDNETIKEVVCTHYVNYRPSFRPILSEEEKKKVKDLKINVKENLFDLYEADVSGEFDDCSGFGWFSFKESVHQSNQQEENKNGE